MTFNKFFNVLSLVAFMLFSSVSLAAPVWVDVRSAQEHTVDNIEGDLRVTHTQITPQISQLFPDKNTEIKLYCRSGVRAQTALLALKKAGYKNVSNIGGIDDARKARLLTQ